MSSVTQNGICLRRSSHEISKENMPEVGNLSQNATVSDQNKGFPKPVLPRRKQQPTAVFLPGESHGQRSLVGCSPGAVSFDTYFVSKLSERVIGIRH